MRKQSYVIIGIGLAALVGIFWLSQLGKQEEATTTVDKQPTSSQETTDASPIEKSIDPFAGMRRQSPSAVEPLSKEDKALAAESKAYRKRQKVYHNSPRGNYLETHQDESEEISESDKERIAKYNALDAQGKAIADLDDWILRQDKRRVSEYHYAMIDEVNRTGNVNLLLRPQDRPATFATVAEEKAADAIDEIKTGWATEPEPWQEVAAFLRDRRDFSQAELDQGDPQDPNWHADHIQWIEQTAQTIGIPLDNPEDQSWIQEKIATAEEQYYQDFNAPMVEEFKKIDEEMAAAFEAWAREPDSHEKEVATQYNQLIKQDRQWRAQREHERRYREEMARNPVFKEMERERQRKERRQARQAEEPAQETLPSSETE